MADDEQTPTPATPPKTPEQLKADEADLTTAAEEWKLSEAAFSKQRENELADQKFESGEHFTSAELQWKKENKKPAFVMDQVSGQVAKVTNQPVHRIVVTANGRGATATTAQYWQGICRRIENLSSAEDVYKWARRHAVIMGRGFWRVRADYFTPIEVREDGQYDPSVFQQDIRIEPILHQHSVHPDPRSKLLDFSDRRFYIITSDVEWTEFKRLHPAAQYSSASDFRTKAATGDSPPEWATEKTVRLAERYYIVDVEVALCVVKAGTPLPTGGGAQGPTVVVKDGKTTYPPDAIIREHTFKIPKVKWMKYTGKEVLERADVPGRYIPVVQIVGERRIIDGVEDDRGMVRGAKDPQRLVDFYESRLASTVDLAAYDTWKAPAEAVEDHEDDYVNAHIDRPGLLLWNHKDETGNPIPAPEHITVAPEIAGIVVAAQRAGMNLRGVLGVPDVTPDETRPEQSGKAIGLRRQEQAQTTSHYGDSTAGGIRHTARIIFYMGREILDVPRILRINGVDEKPVDIVPFDGTKQTPDGQSYAEVARQMAQEAPRQDEHSQERQLLDITLGEFDFTVTAGKGYNTGSEQTVDVMERVLPVLPPQIAIKAIPILVKNIDAPGMVELAKLLEPADPKSGMVPAELIDKAKAAVDALKQENASLAGQLHEKTAELASKEKIATGNNDTTKVVEAARLELEQHRIELEHQLEMHKVDADVKKAEIAARAAAMRPEPNPSPELA